MFARTFLVLLTVCGWTACQPRGSVTVRAESHVTEPPTAAPVDTPAPAPTPTPPTPSGACSSSSDCQVVARGCCPPCRDLNDQGTTRYRPGAFTAAQAAERARTCGVKSVKCAKCAEPGLEPSYLPVCESGRCQLLDVRTSAMSACTSDAECSLRPSTCCGCQSQPVAVSTHGFKLFREAVCEPGLDCSACAIPNYGGVSAVCVDGHCVRKGR